MTLSSKLWHVDKTEVPLIRFAKVKTLLHTKAPLMRGGCQQRKSFDKGNTGVAGEKSGLGWGEGTNEWVHLIVKLTFVWARRICWRTAEEHNCHSSTNSNMSAVSKTAKKHNAEDTWLWELDMRHLKENVDLLLTYGPHIFAWREIGF